MIGQAVGSYRIVGKLGEGGMGAVYVAHHALLGRKAAIKVLLPALSRQAEVVDRFFNEARAVTSVSDPGIVQIFDFGYASDGSAFIVMELLDGQPLNVRLSQRGRLPLLDAARIGRQVAMSLATAHSHGIVHRDLKPENIFMVRDHEVAHGERAKILDFGIAKLSTEVGGKKTNTGALLGTPMYMSPEQCRGAGEVDHRSDIYSLGCMLFHLVVGAPPFIGEGIGDVIVAHLREPAPAPSSRLPGVPGAFDALVLRCLAKQPGERFATMAEVAAALEHLMAQLAAADLATCVMPAAGRPQLGGSYPSPYPSPYPLSNPSPYPMANPSPYPMATPAHAAASAVNPSGLGGPQRTPPPNGPWLISTNGAARSPQDSSAGLSSSSQGSPRSHPGTVALGLPTTLGSAAGARAAMPSRKGRTLGLGVVAAGLAAAGLFFALHREGASAVGGRAPTARDGVSPVTQGVGVSAAQPARPAASASTAPVTATTTAATATTTAAAATTTAATATTTAATATTAAATATTTAATATTAAATTTGGATEAAASAAAASSSSHPSKRHHRPRRPGGTGGCDRSLDTDCDGIPDVR
jgi:eukaryotic-like serine/threonine-protein kinase